MALSSPFGADAERVRARARRVVTLLNDKAGAFNRTLATNVLAQLEQAFAAHGIDADIRFVDGGGLGEAAEAAAEACRRGECDAVVIGGGDGSVRAAAGALAGTDIPLGVLPLGTLNHFSKDLGIPLQLDQAVTIVAAGRDRPVDLAEVNGEIFINNSSIGIYPYMVIDRERRRAAHRIRKWAAMVPAFFRMLRHFPKRRLYIAAEGFARPYRTPCLFVGNNAYETRIFHFGKRPHLDRGELWLYVVKPRSPWKFFLMVCRLCFGRLDQDRDVETLRLREAEIGAKTSRLPVALDGEVQIMPTPLHYRVRPKALRVLVPA